MLRRRITTILSVVIVLVAAGVVFTLRSRTRAHSMMCAGRLFPMMFVAMEQAEESQSEYYPTDLTYLSNRIATKWLICPSDTSRYAASDWSSFTPEHSSYELVTPGLVRTDTNSVFLRCRVHGHMAYGDHTVFDGVRRRHKFD
jgi:hypothetical protein